MSDTITAGSILVETGFHLPAAILFHEWKTRRSISGYSLIGAGWLLAQQLLHFPVAGSETFVAFCGAVAEMVRYR